MSCELRTLRVLGGAGTALSCALVMPNFAAKVAAIVS